MPRFGGADHAAVRSGCGYPPSVSRRRIGLAAAAATALLLLAASLPRVLAWGVERVAREALREQGVDEVAFGAIGVGLGTLRIDRLELGGAEDLVVDRIRASWTLGDLLRTRLGVVRVEGVRARGSLGQEVSLGTLGVLARSALAEEAGPPSFRQLVLADAQLELETPAGSLAVPAEARLEGAGETTVGEATLRVESEAPSVHGTGRVTLGPDATGIELQLQGAKLALAGIQASGFSTQLRAHRATDGASQLTLYATLDDLRLPDTPGTRVERAALSLDLAGSGEVLEGPATLDAKARFDALGPVDVALPGRLRLAVGGPEGGALGGAEDGGPSAHFSSDKAQLALSGLDVAGKGLDASVALRGDAGAATLHAELHVGRLADLRKPARIVPLGLRAAVDRRGDRLEGEVRAAGPSDRLVLRLAGHHDFATGTGAAQVSLAPLDFAPGKLEPGQLFPVLGTRLSETRGHVEASGKLAWRGHGLGSSLDLVVRDFSTATEYAAVEGLETAVHLVSLAPPATAPDQELRVARIQAGFPLEHLEVRFQLEPEGVLRVASARAELLGGSVRTEGALDPTRDANRFVLDVTGADLARLVSQLEIETLSATGTLGGRIPVILRRDGAAVEDGHLDASAEGGVIRYRPGAEGPLPAQAQGVDLLLQALRDFRYQALGITLAGELAGELDIGVHLLGSNPEFYEGHPVEFNLNLEAPLSSIVRGSLTSIETPERLLRSVEERSR
jgi:Dicarboxylate transport